MIQSTDAVKITKRGVDMTKRIIIYGLLFALAISLGVLSISCTNYAPADEEETEFDMSKRPLEKPPKPAKKLNTLVPKTGQTISSAPGDDGDLQKGVAWPNPRFTDNGDGTVTDNLTGLIWLQNLTLLGSHPWAAALAVCNSLAAADWPELTDGSVAGDWRLPNVREFQSLIDHGSYNPAMSDTAGTGNGSEGDPFSNVRMDGYWSSTASSYYGGNAWYLAIFYGDMRYTAMSISARVWPVRDGN